MTLIKLESINSTNQYMKNNINHFNHLDVVYTDYQTNGLGRFQHQWYSSIDSLTFSICLKQGYQLNNFLPSFIAYIIHQSLSSFDIALEIKWPNDILIKGKKVAGVLIETLYQQTPIGIIVGIGINVNQSSFPSSIDQIATSVYLNKGQRIDKTLLFDKIISLIQLEYPIFLRDQQPYINYINQYLAYKNQAIEYTSNQQSYQAKCIKVNDDGSLLIEMNQTHQSLQSNEVIHLRCLPKPSSMLQ